MVLLYRVKETKKILLNKIYLLFYNNFSLLHGLFHEISAKLI